ncbi:MAG: GMP synthase, partial [Anaerolineae bacterium]
MPLHFERLLTAVHAPFTYQAYEITRGEMPRDLDECDAYLITGSLQGVYDSDPWIADLSRFIRAAYQAGKKLVGICFGHQIIAHALGGRAEKSAKGWGLGQRQFALTAVKAWMTPGMSSCGLYFAHQDQVVKLPPGAERLGGDEFCPNTMFTIGDQVLGIQGHPEFTSDFMTAVIASRQDTVPEPVLYPDGKR